MTVICWANICTPDYDIEQIVSAMNVKTLCLAILYDKDVTGYDIRKMSTEGEYAYFVDASFGSIYPALAKLETEGLVSSRIEAQDGKPAKKIYQITDAGRTEFQSELFDSLANDLFRSEFLLFARFAQLLPAELVKARVEAQLADIRNRLDHIRTLLENNSHPGENWVLNHGLICLTTQLDTITASAPELIALARQDAVEAAE